MSYEIFTVGNEAISTKFVDDIKNQTTNKIYVVSSQYYGKELAYDFTLASLFLVNNQTIIDQCICVKSQAALNTIDAFCEDKIVLVNFNCLDFRFTKSLRNTYIFFDTYFTTDIALKIPYRQDFVKQVEKLGFDSINASRISFLIDYNVLALKRLLAKMPLMKIPQWARKKEKSELVPLLLMGEIRMDNEGDIEILRELVGDSYDNYLDILNFWGETNESPIFKYENIYRICARKECFDFIQIDVFSMRIKKLEERLKLILIEPDQKYNKAPSLWYINDGRYIWRTKLIKNIIDGFIILSEKNPSNGRHFDQFVDGVLKNLKGNYILTLTVAPYMCKLAELSSNSFLKYITGSIKDDKENFLDCLKAERKGIHSEYFFAQYLVSALEICLAQSSTCLEALRCLFALHFETEESLELIKNTIINYLSPITTMKGLIPISLTKKIECFFAYINGKDEEKAKNIVTALQKGGQNYMMHLVRNTYKTIENIEGLKVTYQEIFDMQNESLSWLLRHKDSSMLMATLEGVLNNIYIIPFENSKTAIKKFIDKIVNEKLEEEFKSKLYFRVMEEIYKLKRYKNRSEFAYAIPLLEELLHESEPTDLYYKYRGILINDRFPLLDPPFFKEENSYEKEYKLRVEIRQNVIRNLIKAYGENIIEQIIKDCGNNVLTIWQVLYDLSQNHLKDIEVLINNKCYHGLRYYLQRIDLDSLKNVIENSNNAEFVFANLPFNKEVFSLVEGKKYEYIYWRNTSFSINSIMNFEFVFKKCIQFSPTSLLGYFAYNKQDYSYSQGIELLEAISEVQEDEYFKERINTDIYALQDIINSMDDKYYTDELALCEFKLLPFILDYKNNYPLGLRKYFWEHPEALGKLLVSLHTQKESLMPNSIGAKMYYSVIYNVGENCYIPKDYLIQKKDMLKQWVDKILTIEDCQDSSIKLFIKSAIINTLSCCPKNPIEKKWPIDEIADILEDLSKEDFEDPYEVASKFYCAFVNSRGVRSVEDGTAEFALSDEFTHYQEEYKFTHPITSKALGYIAEIYKEEGKSDRIITILGES